MRSNAFTLIELLIVIGIIGILMGLLFPAVSSAILAARRAQARDDAGQIVNACRAYETEYGVGVWGTNSYTQVDGDLLTALMGTNARRIIILEVPTPRAARADTATACLSIHGVSHIRSRATPITRATFESPAQTKARRFGQRWLSGLILKSRIPRKPTIFRQKGGMLSRGRMG